MRVRSQRTPIVGTSWAGRRCIQQSAARRGSSCDRGREEAFAEELVKLTVRTRLSDFMQRQFSSETKDKVFTSSWIKKLEVLVGRAKKSRATQMSRTEKFEAQHC